jgi:hypothetical protein
VGDDMSHGIDANGVLDGLRLLLAAGLTNEVDSRTGPYRFDLTDTHRQFLVDLFSDAHALLAVRWVVVLRCRVALNPPTSVDNVGTKTRPPALILS